MNNFAAKRAASTCIIPMCDVLRLDETGRINSPGLLSEVNWTWRLKDFAPFDGEIKRLHKLFEKTNRI